VVAAVVCGNQKSQEMRRWKEDGESKGATIGCWWSKQGSK